MQLNDFQHLQISQKLKKKNSCLDYYGKYMFNSQNIISFLDFFFNNF